MMYETDYQARPSLEGTQILGDGIMAEEVPQTLALALSYSHQSTAQLLSDYIRAQGIEYNSNTEQLLNELEEAKSRKGSPVPPVITSSYPSSSSSFCPSFVSSYYISSPPSAAFFNTASDRAMSSIVCPKEEKAESRNENQSRDMTVPSSSIEKSTEGFNDRMSKGSTPSTVD